MGHILATFKPMCLYGRWGCYYIIKQTHEIVGESLWVGLLMIRLDFTNFIKFVHIEALFDHMYQAIASGSIVIFPQDAIQTTTDDIIFVCVPDPLSAFTAVTGHDCRS
jgi:hypothetical protein